MKSLSLRRGLFALLASLCALTTAWNGAFAAEAAPLAADPVAEKRLQALGEELRCLVCQNQTIADSNADLAQDLRREIRGLIQAGKSDREIVDFMVARYGDFVLYRPPFKATTALLWLGPLLLMLAGLAALVHNLRRRGNALADEAPLSEDEAGRAAALLEEAKHS